jgi:hypothetical protein
VLWHIEVHGKLRPPKLDAHRGHERIRIKIKIKIKIKRGRFMGKLTDFRLIGLPAR